MSSPIVSMKLITTLAESINKVFSLKHNKNVYLLNYTSIFNPSNKIITKCNFLSNLCDPISHPVLVPTTDISFYQGDDRIIHYTMTSVTPQNPNVVEHTLTEHVMQPSGELTKLNSVTIKSDNVANIVPVQLGNILIFTNARSVQCVQIPCQYTACREQLQNDNKSCIHILKSKNLEFGLSQNIISNSRMVVFDMDQMKCILDINAILLPYDHPTLLFAINSTSLLLYDKKTFELVDTIINCIIFQLNLSLTFIATDDHMFISLTGLVGGVNRTECAVWKFIRETDIPEDEQCVECFKRRDKFALVPCGHMCMCVKCFEQVLKKDNKCPKCRAVIQSKLTIFS